MGTPIAPIWPSDEDLFFGLWILGLTTLFIPIYLRYLYCVKCYFKNIPAYNLVLHNGIPSVAQLAVEWFFGLLCTASLVPPAILNKICGALWNAAFHSSMFNLLILAVNRFVVIYSIRPLHDLFAGKSSGALVIAQYLWGALLFVVYMLPSLSITFTLPAHSFEFSGLPLGVQFDLFFSDFVLSVAFFLYGIVFIFIFKKRRSKQIERHELRILINVFGLQLSFAILIAAFHLWPLFWSSNSALSVLNLVRIARSGFDPLLVIATNRCLRRRFLSYSNLVITVTRNGAHLPL
ncbi:hypothetical protein L596_008844 [Steinernema carpocapsae]|uniref:7TM GPCR serpentine receptor class x (Srx) domain-containing protein n=1 Tax=Steinernema carpocapsae TaxID=34508 RepID=A0A4U5PDM9_STECR|nr:hypothetical protein L596_008844 [Steinernema carpocapsae]